MFNYWKDLVLGSVETYFLEVGAYVSPKRASTGLWEGRICWIWVKIPLFCEYENGGVRPKDFTVYLLEWSCLRLGRYVFS